MTELERALLHIKTRADAWAVKEVEKALSQEPCDDAISREAVIELCKNIIDKSDLVDVAYEVRRLPSVTQKSKTGHWIFDEILDMHYYCSECKSIGVDYWDYCPNCGCRMFELQERSEE